MRERSSPRSTRTASSRRTAMETCASRRTVTTPPRMWTPASRRCRSTARCWPRAADSIPGMARGSKSTLERLQEPIRTADRGWFFAAVADRVAERRQEKGLSQRELAELVGTTQSAIARLERGGRPPRIDTLLRIADALECELVVDLEPRR